MNTSTRSTARDRFWRHVDRLGGPEQVGLGLGRCWVWTSSKNPKGYGQFGNHDRSIPGSAVVTAHRAAYFFEHGELPGSGLLVRHLCNNPPCVRPSHLEAGTAKQNADDCGAASRRPIGESHPSARLKTTDVITIRTRLSSGEQAKDIAADFGVSSSLVGSIGCGRLWSSVGGPITPSRGRNGVRLGLPIAAVRQ